MDFEFRTVFNTAKVQELASWIKAVYADFDSNKFVNEIAKDIDALNYKDRMLLITYSLEKHLPKDYAESLNVLIKALPPELDTSELSGFDNFIIMPLTHFVARNGLEHFEISTNALYEMTKRFTAEGDIRPFIEKYPDKMQVLLAEWAKDKNLHVRRLVSEGTRPRLPLGSRLHQFVKDPKPVIDLLELLKNDEVLYVRRSVANNLNDISKDNPQIVCDTLERWNKEISTPEMKWLTSHALRTLIKQGYLAALKLMGIAPAKFEINNFKLKPEVKIGEEQIFSFDISNTGEAADFMIDFIIEFKKANGKNAPKVFKLKKLHIDSAETRHLEKKYSFQERTTRKLYTGEHYLSLQINGEVWGRFEFEVVV